ncbi:MULTISPECIES: helix-turn-helix domain-containing protein [unclassified Parabacteroides]|uniref:helix-turn-helix domain-containing protein n=1 Tax=unclassified Parabacteroides TaxID=2649774 RepID=UPI002474BCB9|nr:MULTISPECIES: helix-turn-helix domain-containing protein [unclassified Parabacteroides]
MNNYLTSGEAAGYLHISMSTLYKLTMRREIPHYKPTGKLCYFNRQELDEWISRNRIATTEEINNTASEYCLKNGGRRA